MPFFCLKQSQGFEDLSSTQSLPKLPFSLPPVEKTKLQTPGGCSEGVTGKRRESLKTFMLKNGHTVTFGGSCLKEFPTIRP